ncbi:hypothetical protein B0H16DRAFT_1472235 [Mycena metata]|uniref:Uncharacterized protein n=1 Tax=Mycena metata TaxID=1033252 RepID=A0AAD7MNX1_9AGAR|nr:hypothetical protein B0H16DRAFT_1472235 [Mycena metata]
MSVGFGETWHIVPLSGTESIPGCRRTSLPRANVEMNIFQPRNWDHWHVIRPFDNLVAPYSTRLTSLTFEVAVGAVLGFLRLPAGSFPALRCLTICAHHNTHGVWLLFDCHPEGDIDLTPVSRLAPHLSSFSFSGESLCTCQMDPLAIGLDLDQLRELRLRVAIPPELAHAMLSQCTRLEECAVHIGAGVDDQYESDEESVDLEFKSQGSNNEDMFTIDSLTRLEMWCRTTEELEKFLTALNCPALNSFGLTVTRPRAFIRAALTTLMLSEVGTLSKEDLECLLSQQPRIESVSISECGGEALMRPLVPRLQSFYAGFTEDQLDCLIRFVETRRGGGGRTVTLRKLELDPVFPYTRRDIDAGADSSARILHDAVLRWRHEYGMTVEVDLEETAGDSENEGTEED